MPSTAIHTPGAFLKEVLEEQEMGIHTETVPVGSGKGDTVVKINKHQVLIMAKAEINPVNLPKMLKEATAKQEENLLFFGEYITPKAKELFKEKAINYLDGAGNLYLKLPGLLLHIEANENPSVAPKYKSRAFSKAGGAVVFQFLRDPGLVNRPQRLIAEYAGVSLGTIPKVFEGLRKEGFLIKVNKSNWELTDTEELLHKWIEVLRDKILPSKLLGRYQPVGTTAKKLLEDKKLGDGLQWGGEPAAALLTHYLVPEVYSLFVENKEELISKHKLVPSPKGELKVYEKFWYHPEEKTQQVDPLLVYAQLVASGESRNRETAQLIYDDHLGAKL